jgi:hypothetical protein
LVVALLQMFCPLQQNQPPTMGGQFVVDLFAIVVWWGEPLIDLLTSIIEPNKGIIAM